MPEETFSMMPGQDGKPIKSLDMEFTTTQEAVGFYELSDGTVLEAKLVPLKAGRGYDKNADRQIARKEDGEPIYNLRFHVAVSARLKEDLLKVGE